MNKFRTTRVRYMACAITLMSMLMIGAGAETLAESNIGVGLKNLINDVGTYVLLLCPVVAGAVAVVFLIRRSMADEADGKMWTKRITVSIVCGVSGMLVGGVIKLISSYFV